MNYIDLNGEMVTPKTESMAYTQINQRMDVLERSIHSEITNTASVIDNRISDEINTVNGRAYRHSYRKRRNNLWQCRNRCERTSAGII